MTRLYPSSFFLYETSNFRNTVGSLKRLIGRTITDPEVQEIEKKFTHVNLVDVNGTVGAEVRIRDIFLVASDHDDDMLNG